MQCQPLRIVAVAAVVVGSWGEQKKKANGMCDDEGTRFDAHNHFALASSGSSYVMDATNLRPTLARS